MGNWLTIQDLGFIVADYDLNGISADPQNDEIHGMEREIVTKSLFPPIILKELQAYQALRSTPYVLNMSYLERNSHYVFVFLRKLISFFFRISSK